MPGLLSRATLGERRHHSSKEALHYEGSLPFMSLNGFLSLAPLGILMP